MTIVIVGVKYEEFKPETYQGVTVAIEGEETKIFNDHGDFYDDSVVALHHAYSLGTVIHSSTVAHYMEDDFQARMTNNPQL